MSWQRQAEATALSYSSTSADLSGTGIPTTCTMRGGQMILSYAHSAAAYPIIRHNSVNLPLNNAVALGAESMARFSIDLPEGASFTIRFSATGTVRFLTLKSEPEKPV